MVFLRQLFTLSVLTFAANIAYADSLTATIKKAETAVSGHTGSSYSYSAQSSGKFLAHLEFREKKDDPCYASIGYYGKKNGDITHSGHTHDKCKPGTTWASAKSVGDADKSQDRTHVKGIYKLQVCTNKKAKSSSKEVFKGIRVWFKNINLETGKIIGEAGTEFFQRTNCKKWHRVVQCPQGSVATGIHLHSNDRNNNGHIDIRGISMECSTPGIFKIKKKKAKKL